ncbi:MAG TPA: hypothetical protein VLD39_00310 [Gammaproteobacteria bacterium]|nr:hypothetical protein [Gammaproteobacteria bacterium]
MLPAMIEEGPDAFVQRWRAYAGDATLFARPEGSPLLEASLGGTVVQLLERTNPYLAVPGRARLLVNASATLVARDEGAERDLSVPLRGSLNGCGTVLEREGRLVALDAGWPVVVALPDDADAPSEGETIRFEAAAPIHAFVLPPERRTPSNPGREVDEAH